MLSICLEDFKYTKRTNFVSFKPKVYRVCLEDLLSILHLVQFLSLLSVHETHLAVLCLRELMIAQPRLKSIPVDLALGKISIKQQEQVS